MGGVSALSLCCLVIKRLCSFLLAKYAGFIRQITKQKKEDGEPSPQAALTVYKNQSCRGHSHRVTCPRVQHPLCQHLQELNPSLKAVCHGCGSDLTPVSSRCSGEWGDRGDPGCPGGSIPKTGFRPGLILGPSSTLA
jgi:hypothetical protein